MSLIKLMRILVVGGTGRIGSATAVANRILFYTRNPDDFASLESLVADRAIQL